MIVAFAAGACFGMIIASIFAAAGRCSYEEEVRAYYERRIPNWRRRKREDRGIHQSPEDVAEAPRRYMW